MQIKPSDLSEEIILIVDDSVNNLNVLSTTLLAEGYSVRCVKSGKMALIAVQASPPSLILLDIRMPDMNGYEVCEQLKQNHHTRDIPVIFLSALDAVEDKVKAFTSGGIDYITKPFQAEEVLARVKTHLELRLLTKNLEVKNTLLKQKIEEQQRAETNLQQALHDLKTAQEQIIAREKLASLGVLTAGIAHELRNPLNFIVNYAEGTLELLEELQEEIDHNAPPNEPPALLDTIRDLLSEVNENSVTILNQGKRAERIIATMMQHSRNSTNQKQLADLNHVVEDAVHLVYHSKRAQNQQFNLAIRTSYDSSIGSIPMIEADLSRALINIIDNACYAAQAKVQKISNGEKPEVSVSTVKQGGKIEIHIRDNGEGILPEHQKQIFNPFFTTKPPGQGTGLGLSMAYDIIIGQHNGTIHVETAPGNYTEFIITLQDR